MYTSILLSFISFQKILRNGIRLCNIRIFPIEQESNLFQRGSFRLYGQKKQKQNTSVFFFFFSRWNFKIGLENERQKTYLDEENPNNDKFNNDPGDVEEVKFPCKGVDAEGIDVGVESAGGAGEEPEEGYAFGTDGVGEYFDDWVRIR